MSDWRGILEHFIFASLFIIGTTAALTAVVAPGYGRPLLTIPLVITTVACFAVASVIADDPDTEPQVIDDE